MHSCFIWTVECITVFTVQSLNKNGTTAHAFYIHFRSLVRYLKSRTCFKVCMKKNRLKFYQHFYAVIFECISLESRYLLQCGKQYWYPGFLVKFRLTVLIVEMNHDCSRTFISNSLQAHTKSSVFWLLSHNTLSIDSPRYLCYIQSNMSAFNR